MGPEHAFLQASGRARYEAATDAEALAALELLARTEGIIPALESAHAIHGGVQLAKLDRCCCLFVLFVCFLIGCTKRSLKPEDNVLICLSGRGDKDVMQVAKIKGFQV